jgi:hypothetical protein
MERLRLALLPLRDPAFQRLWLAPGISYLAPVQWQASSSQDLGRSPRR